MRRPFALTFAALTLAFGATACQPTASSGAPAPQKLVAAQDSTTSSPPSASPSAPAAPTTPPPSSPAGSAPAAEPTTAHSTAPTQRPPAKPAPITAPSTKPTPAPTHPAPPPTSASACIHHTVGRCGAGEPHPSGVMALCVDGTPSYSTTPQGTCSHHGGVAVWYY